VVSFQLNTLLIQLRSFCNGGVSDRAGNDWGGRAPPLNTPLDRSTVVRSHPGLRACMSVCLSPAKSLNFDCVRLWPVSVLDLSKISKGGRTAEAGTVARHPAAGEARQLGDRKRSAGDRPWPWDGFRTRV
jgi:hypothetical protein